MIDTNRIFYFITDNKKSIKQLKKMQMPFPNTMRKCLALLM